MDLLITAVAHKLDDHSPEHLQKLAGRLGICASDCDKEAIVAAIVEKLAMVFEPEHADPLEAERNKRVEQIHKLNCAIVVAKASAPHSETEVLKRVKEHKGRSPSVVSQKCRERWAAKQKADEERKRAKEERRLSRQVTAISNLLEFSYDTVSIADRSA